MVLDDAHGGHLFPAQFTCSVFHRLQASLFYRHSDLSLAMWKICEGSKTDITKEKEDEQSKTDN